MFLEARVRGEKIWCGDGPSKGDRPLFVFNGRLKSPRTGLGVNKVRSGHLLLIRWDMSTGISRLAKGFYGDLLKGHTQNNV